MNPVCARLAVVGCRSAFLLVTALPIGTSALFAEEIAPDVELIRGTFIAGSQPDGNTVVLRATDGLVIIDTGRHPAHTQTIVEFARSAGLPVRVVLNSHWHLDHVGGNPTLRREFPGLRVVASGAIGQALTGFLANYRRQLETLVAQAESAEAAKPFRAELAILDAGGELVPDEVVSASGRRTLAGRELDIHLATHAVTAGDLWLVDTATRTLVAGDLVTLPAPLFDTACPERWSLALGELATIDFALLVPGHGEPLDRTGFDRYRSAFDRLLVCAASDATAPSCTDGWLADSGDLIPEADRRLARGLVDYYVGQVLRGDAGRRAALCGDTESR